MATYNVKIDGMGCDRCVAKVKGALDALSGTCSKVEIGSAVVETGLSKDEIKKAIEATDFDVISID